MRAPARARASRQSRAPKQREVAVQPRAPKQREAAIQPAVQAKPAREPAREPEQASSTASPTHQRVRAPSSRQPESSHSQKAEEKQSELMDGSKVGPISKPLDDDDEDDELITVRAHNKKTGEVTIMRVPKGTPMREVMSRYAASKGVKAERLSWKRRSSPASPVHDKIFDDDDCVDCGCHSYI